MSEFFKSLSVILASPYRFYKVASGVILQAPMTLLSMYRLKKKRKNIWICFDYKTGTYADFFIAIYKRLKATQPELEMGVLITPVSKNWRLDSRFSYGDFIPEILYKRIPKKIVIHATALTDVFLHKEKNTRHIQINHGFGSFVAVLDEQYIRNVSMFFANTEYQVYQLTEGPYKGYLQPEQVRRIGYPKIDGPVADEINIAPKIKSIFYGPTYHRDISSIFDFLDPLITYCSHEEITLYIKLHPLLAWSYDHEKSGGIDWFKRIRELQKRHPNIVLLPTTQPFGEVVKVFHACDLFMTDNSGFGFEFVLITGKPIVFLGNKLKIPLNDTSSNNVGKYLHFPEIKVRGEIGPVIVEAKTLKPQLDYLLKEGLSKYREKLQKFRNEFTFNPGAASKPAVNAIMELVKELKQTGN